MTNELKNYACVTASYWGFTLSDGALRMLVLLHFHHLGYTPLDLAFLFLLYEAMGIVTNFVGGWIGARFGLRLTLFAGLSTQIVALTMLSLLQEGWTIAFSVAYVMAAQALSGVAKDLTKMSSKSAVKLVVADEGLLFKWVSLLTGSKNALKGIGFFLGGLLLEMLGFQMALWSMAGALALILIFAVAAVQRELGKAKSKITGKDLFSKSREINILSFARIFLFASRDVWFVVGLPIFMAEKLGWSFDEIGLFMAAWIVGYGIIQAFVPKITRKTTDAKSGANAAKLWGFILFILPASLTAACYYLPDDITWILISGLLVFALVFAVNSSVHSFLIVAYSDADKVSLSVGFYYMANAVGRLLGTLLSGLVYQMAGLEACLGVSALMVLIAATSVMFLNKKGQNEISPT
ncbi:Permease of the major facilitator superfamily [Candidatus Terasakiella magnetica]|uniref:Permease of the major facilitator superfamily n=1 Tax=Candidatus Terasakiella magnetica TaxID=1867952 RepID=A0A1C3RF05_9PROT|nr:organoarsenical effux MFS transporter ArsJ [Candidatus Terasakiella magnetica]SCA55849.1 Permease of the major facilitator superfamily [Candidatus Terasakiella magnetica]